MLLLMLSMSLYNMYENDKRWNIECINQLSLKGADTYCGGNPPF